MRQRTFLWNTHTHTRSLDTDKKKHSVSLSLTHVHTHAPLLQCVDDVRQLVGTEVTAHTEVHLHLLVALVQFPVDDVAVDGLDEQVLQLAHVFQLQLLEQQRVGKTLWGKQMLVLSQFVNNKKPYCSIFEEAKNKVVLA